MSSRCRDSRAGTKQRIIITTVLVSCSCGARMPASEVPERDEITLYRDHALVAQRVVVDVEPASAATVRVSVAAGTQPQDISLVDRDNLTITGAHEVGHADANAAVTVELTIAAPHAGQFVAQLAYATAKLRWQAGYHLTTTPAHDTASLHGALDVTNATGVPFRGARVHVIDADLGMWRGEVAHHLAGTLVGQAELPASGARPRLLGTIDLAPGDTRVTLVDHAPPNRMRPVLVYDPIGTKLDTKTTTPVRDLGLGVSPPATTRVDEAFQVERGDDTAGLPAGPVRLVERRPDGSLVLLATARMFEDATRKSAVDLIPIGTATGVTGHRERRDISIDDTRRRMTEEMVITIDNTRTNPVSVVVREHLYRSLNWTLAYYSAPRTQQEGSQQVSMHVDVPAKQAVKLLYVAVYPLCSDDGKCP